MPADNVERFAFIYEMDEKPMTGAISKAESSIDNFVKVTTKGFTGVVSLAQEMFTDLARLGGRGIANALDRMGFSIEKQTYLIVTAQEAAHKLHQGYELAAQGATALAKGASYVFKPIRRLMSSMDQGSKSAFQMENRLAGVGSTLKMIAKIGGFAVILGPFLPLIRPFMTLISAISDTLQPAMDTIAGALKAALAPLTMAFHKLALKILPYLMKMIEPFIGILLKGVDALTKFFDDGSFEELVGVFDELVPLVQEIADSFVRDFLKPVGGTLFRTVIKMFMSLVGFAVKFVKTIKPYLPKFFEVFNKIVDLIINTLGDTFDTLMVELGKQLPILNPLLTSMLKLFKSLLPALEKLLPPLTEIFVQVLAKFLVPAGVKILDELAKGMTKLLENSEPTIEAIAKFLGDIAKWWEENEDVFPRVWRKVKEALEEVKPILEAVVKIVGTAIGKIIEAIGLIIDMRKESQERETEKEQMIRILQKRSNVRLQEAQFDQETARQLDRYRQQGKDEAWIAQHKKRRAVERAKIQVTAMQAAVELREWEKKAEGGYILQRQLVEVGEAGPEWIVPDTPAGMMKYIPQMLESAFGEGAGKATAGSATALLADIRMLLASIDMKIGEMAEGDALPPALT